MPISLVEVIKGVGKWGIWEITEDEDTLLTLYSLSDTDKLYFDTIKNGKKRTQGLAYRVLLRHLLEQDISIVYNSKGKPFLENNTAHISVSHSGKYASAFVSPTHLVGIDIEKISERMPALASRFLTPLEMNTVNLKDSQLLHVYWGAKECLYKMYSDKEPLFSEHLLLQAFDFYNPQKSSFISIKTHDFEQKHRLFYKEIDGYMLVYTY